MTDSSVHTAPNVNTTQVLYPCLRYADAPGAIRWLGEAFGFEPQAVYEGPDNTIAHAQLTLNGAAIMLGSAREEDGRPAGAPYPVKTPQQLGGITGSIYVYIAEPDAHCARARAAGATITAEPYNTEYGSREYAASDPEGYWWSFGTYHP